MAKPAKPVSALTRQRQSRAQLTLKQMRFVKEYAHLGNGSEAARRAGYKNGPRVGQIAVENLQKPAIRPRSSRNWPGWTRRSRLGGCSAGSTRSATQPRPGQFGPAVRAEELLGKSIGMWIDQSIQSQVVERQSRAALLEQARKRQHEPIDLEDDGDGNRKQDSNERVGGYSGGYECVPSTDAHSV